MNSLFNTLRKKIDLSVPFVAYRKPKESRVKVVMQHSKELIVSEDYKETGFVFAPFDNHSKTVLIPFDEVNEFAYEVHNREACTPDFPVVSNSIDNKTHIALVEKARTAIANSDLEKVVLSRLAVSPHKQLDVVAVFKELLSNYVTAFVYLWHHPKVGTWLGASPEQLVQIRGSIGKTMALAGTQVYSEKRLWTQKERTEQQFVTDYIVDSLNNMAATFTSSDTYTDKAGHLAHLRTDINFRLLPSTTLRDVLHELHPTPAVCGMPKNIAKKFILANEGYDRSFYTGFLGEINIEKNRSNNKQNTENKAYGFNRKYSDLYVNLRCMEIFDTYSAIYVGGGITKDSNPENEFIETVNKSQTMLHMLSKVQQHQ
jgi:isochorismate synthase